MSNKPTIPKLEINQISTRSYKYNEDVLLEELKEYIDSTYEQHYSREKFQAAEIILDCGHGTGFCLGNVMKYAQRYGKKGTPDDSRKDLMKILHYTMIALHNHDKEFEGVSY